MTTLRPLLCCLVAILSLSAATLATTADDNAADDNAADDNAAENKAVDDKAVELKRLLGRWERTFTNPAGTQFRVIKEVFENYDTVTTYDDVGNIVTAHRSDFKIEKRGPVRTFSFFNSVVTAGPDKGAQHFETNTYIYRVDDDSFIEVWGLLDGDPNPVRVLGWKRLKTPK